MWVLKTTSVMLLITLSLPGVLGGPYGVTSDNVSPCALRRSSVVFGCSYDYPSRDIVTNTIWFGLETNTWTDIFQNQAFSERVEYLGNNKHNCTLRICNLRLSDAKHYHFRFLTDRDKWSDKKGVVLSVTELTADVNPATVREGERVTLTCVTTCTLSDHPTIVWFRDGHSVSNSEFLASIQDAGSYQCAVRGQDHLSSDPVSLDIQYAPRNTLVSVSPSGPVVEGSSVNLTCSSHANPAVENYT
uniref:Ig-like domain-containing protein n=1 Tax=Hucho hucho TaxID=62062 RepID=A0A4W5P8H0_9TELE